MTGFDHPELRPATLSAVTIALTAAAGAIDVVTFFVVAIVLMARVTRANHGGLYTGEPQSAPDPRAEVPDAGHVDGEPEPVGHVHGRVIDAGGSSRPAALTLVDMSGRQVHRAHTEPDGTYELRPPESGQFVLICAPQRGAARPLARGR